MKLSDLRTWSRAITPGLKLSVVGNPLLDLAINAGVRDITQFTKCLKKNKTFDVVANEPSYSITENISDFLVPDDSGLWWNDGTRWRKIVPKTLEWLDDNKPTWRDLAANRPLNYSIDGDALTIVPKPNTALTDGFLMYYGANPKDMTASGHFPFVGTTTERPSLVVFDDAIISYVQWKTKPMINKKADQEQARQEYFQIRQEKYDAWRRRPDVQAERSNRLQGPRIPSE